MPEDTEGVRKLTNYLKKKYPQREEAELERIAHSLYGLGLFLVRLRMNAHRRPTEPEDPKPT